MPFPLPAIPPTEVLLLSLGLGLGLLLFLAACCGPFLAVVSEWLALSKGSSFYKKAARQLSVMSLSTGSFVFALFAAALAFMLRWQPELLAPPYFYPLLIVAGMACLAELFLLLHVAAWNPGKGAGLFHSWLGLKAWGCASLALFLGVSFARRILHTPPSPADGVPLVEQLLQFFAIPLHSLLIPLMAECLALSCASAGALATLWLLLFRQRQDYGRDYYSFALPYCAKWAMAGTLTALPLGALTYVRAMDIMLPELSHLPSQPLLGLTCALPLIALGLWFAVCKSATPLRHKIGLVTAALCLAAAVTAQVYMLNKMLPSP